MVSEYFTEEDQSRIKLLSPQEILSFLDEKAPEETQEEVVAGYKVTVKQADRPSTDLGRLILSSLEKLKRSKQ